MRIGVIRYWADRPAAEHEVIARLRAAASARDHELVELNPDGTSLDDAAHVPRLDMVLNLHYSSPKSLDVPHIGALWNPLDFYHKFGFVPHFANQLSHDYLATCGSQVLEAAMAPFRPDLFREGQPLPVLNHSVPERYLSPTPTADRRLFYVGVNWERLGAPAGRHDILLARLDAAGLSRIYGPRFLDGIEPWGGFATYQGDLPFDGWSVVQAISDSGAALVLSSPAHYRDEVMSSRPFEASAAGVPMISERHPFMLRHFADAALFFDERAPIADQAEEITSLLAQLNAAPDEALRLATAAQKILREQFNLDDQFDAMVTSVQKRVAAERAARPAPNVAVTAVVVATSEAADVRRWLESNASVLSEFTDVVIAAPDTSRSWLLVAEGLAMPARVVVPTRSDTGWSTRASLAASDVEGTVCFLTGTEKLWTDYPTVVEAVLDGAVAGLVPGVELPAPSHVQANARLPRLLSGGVSSWWELPVSSVVTTGEHLLGLRQLLGPGLHLGVAAEAALDAHAREPHHVPVFTVPEADRGSWSIGSLVGQERHGDAHVARALPLALVSELPPSVLTPSPQVATSNAQLKARLGDALRSSRLPKPVTEAVLATGRAALRARRRRR